jgi:hypothetical protein
MATTQLPKIRSTVIDAVTDMLMVDQGMTRPPEKSAALLALLVEVHKLGEPAPTRQTMAAAVARSTDGSCSIFTIDAALSTRLSEGYLTQAVETPHGHVAKRNSVVRERYYVPSKRLIDVVDRAKRRASSLAPKEPRA